MKVSKKQQQAFNPITIEITFETEREYKLFKQLIGNVKPTEVINIAHNGGTTDPIKDIQISEASQMTTIIYNELIR